MSKIVVRLQKDKRGSYYLDYHDLLGNRRRLRVGTLESVAQKIAVKYTEWLMDGKNPEAEISKMEQRAKARNVTVKEFFPIFMKRHGSQQSVSMQNLYEAMFKNICRAKEIADCAIGSVTRGLILDYMHARIERDHVKNATVNREASFLRGMLSRAVEWDIMSYNPVQKIKLLRESPKREVDLSVEAIEKFYLSHHAAKLLKKVIGRQKSGPAFVNPDTQKRYTKSILKTFRRHIRELNIRIEDGSYLRFHDLRHVNTSWLKNQGVSLEDIRVLLGHLNVKTTDRYVTVDKSLIGKHLNKIPQIRRSHVLGESAAIGSKHKLGVC